jgi:hypothetical protein
VTSKRTRSTASDIITARNITGTGARRETPEAVSYLIIKLYILYMKWRLLIQITRKDLLLMRVPMRRSMAANDTTRAAINTARNVSCNIFTDLNNTILITSPFLIQTASDTTTKKTARRRRILLTRTS